MIRHYYRRGRLSAVFTVVIVAGAVAVPGMQSGCNVIPKGDEAPAEREISLTTTRDSTLYEDSEGTLGNGSGQHVFAGATGEGQARRALLMFDVAGSVPSGSHIISARLRLTQSRTSLEDARGLSLHKVLSDWGEGASDAAGGEGAGAEATAGDATWRHTFFPDSFWNDPGGDFSAAASATANVGDVGLYEWGPTDEMAEDVQGWLDSPASNHGWILIGDENSAGSAKRFDSRENASEENRPTLIVSYAEPQ